MSNSQKLGLENRIFARASACGATVHAVRGGLFSPSANAELQILIFYYNLFFGLAYDPNDGLCEPYALFLSACPVRALFKAPPVGLDARDLPSELWYAKQN